MSTKRPQNRCGKCGYTWHPRGKDISLRCPKCGNTNVSKVGAGSLIGGLAFLAYLFLHHGNEPTAVPKAEKPAINKAVQRDSKDTYVEAANTKATPVFKSHDLPVWNTQNLDGAAPDATSDAECLNRATLFLKIACENSSVADADLKMRAAFEQAVASASEPAAIRAGQHRWETAVRDKCVDAECLLESYQAREAVLKKNQ